MIKAIREAKNKLIEMGVSPPYSIRLSVLAHDQLAVEIGIDRGSRAPVRVFEIEDMRVEIDEKCPAGGAYLVGEERGQAEKSGA